MRLSLNQSRSWLSLSSKLFSKLGIIDRNIERYYSFYTYTQNRSHRLPYFLHPKQYIVSCRVSIHDNPSDNDQFKKQSLSTSTDDEREFARKLLESCPGKEIKQIENSHDVSVYAAIAEHEYKLQNYDAAIKMYELLVNQTFDLEWLPYWQMCLGHCYELKKPPSRDIIRAWHHYECALTKYPEQITLDIMLRVMHSSLSVLEELGKPYRAVERCAQIIDTTYKSENKEKQHGNIAYQIFHHVRMTYMFKRSKEIDKILFHAIKALTLYKQKRENGSIVKLSNNDDLKTILKWIAEVCIAQEDYDAALFHLYALVDVLAGEDKETSYNFHQHPSYRVSVNSMLGSVFQQRNKGEWRVKH